MPHKLLTFLGASEYKQCVYELDERTSPVVRFVQEALAGMVCANWTSADGIYVFLTDDAKVQNWEGAKYNNHTDDSQGLAEKLKALNLPCQIIPVDGFTEGFGTPQIWANFNRIFETLEPGDHIWLDITNAFRSIPIFASVLLNYARFLKGITVQAVFYGAFEALKVPAYEIDLRIPNPLNRKVPIINLSGLIELQHWTNAANDFLTHGNAKELSFLSREKGHQDLAQALDKVTQAFAVVRGKEIVKGQIFENLREALYALEDSMITPALSPILKKINEAFDVYRKEDTLNGFRGAQWCYEHQLYQQGITIVRETIVSLIANEVHLPVDDFQRGRKYIEQAFNCYGRDRIDWIIDSKDIPTIDDIIASTSLVEFAGIYQKLSHQYRNDINHGGFLKNAKPAQDFSKALHDSLTELKTFINF